MESTEIPLPNSFSDGSEEFWVSAPRFKPRPDDRSYHTELARMWALYQGESTQEIRFSSIPSGYRVLEDMTKPRGDPLILQGHSKGPFRSPGDFYQHFSWMMTQEIRGSCQCRICNGTADLEDATGKDDEMEEDKLRTRHQNPLHRRQRAILPSGDVVENMSELTLFPTATPQAEPPQQPTPPRENINIHAYKEIMTSLFLEGLSNVAIRERLWQEYSFSVSDRTIGKRLREWEVNNLPRKDTKSVDLTALRDEIEALWAEEGGFMQLSRRLLQDYEIKISGKALKAKFVEWDLIETPEARKREFHHLDECKDKIVSLWQDDTKPERIAEILREDLGIKITRWSIARRLQEWGFKTAESRAVNLEPYKESILSAFNKGTSERMIARQISQESGMRVVHEVIRVRLRDWIGFNGGPRQVDLSLYKDEILALYVKRKKPEEIRKDLRIKHDITVAISTLEQQLQDWDTESLGAENAEDKVKAESDVYLQRRMSSENLVDNTEARSPNPDSELDRKVDADKQGQSSGLGGAELQDTRGDRFGTPLVDPLLPTLQLPWRNILSKPSKDLLPQHPRPVDMLDPEELLRLENAIKSAYECGGPTRELTGPSDVVKTWPRLLTHALACDEDVNILMVCEYHQPGLFWSVERLLNPLWILGLYLPGCYVTQDLMSNAEIIEVVNSITREVLQEVHRFFLATISEVIKSASRNHEKDYLKAALETHGATTPPKCVHDLLQITRLEIDLIQHEVGLVDMLLELQGCESDIPSLGSLSRCQNRLRRAPSALKDFTCATLKALKAWYNPSDVPLPLPPLSRADLESFDQLSSKRSAPSQEDSEDSDSEPEDLSNSSLQVDLSVKDEFTFTDRSRLLSLLVTRLRRSKVAEVPLVYSDWRGPTTGPLVGFPPCRFDLESWRPVAPGVLSKSPLERDLEAAARNETTSTYISTDQTLERSIEYLCKIISSQTDAERAFYQSHFDRFRSCTSTPFDAKYRRQPVAAFSRWGLAEETDDWYIARRILQLLAARCSFTDEIYQRLEIELIAVLVACGHGSTEATVWMIALEGVLLSISQEVSLSGDQVDSRVLNEELLRELATFAHWIAMKGVFTRYPSLYSHGVSSIRNAPFSSQKWYSLAFQMDHRCADDQCPLPLPFPRDFIDSTVNRYIRTGTRDARRGSPHIREFICGKNYRRTIYECLSNICRGGSEGAVSVYLPVVYAIFFYATVYHKNSICKYARGKYRQNY